MRVSVICQKFRRVGEGKRNDTNFVHHTLWSSVALLVCISRLYFLPFAACLFLRRWNVLFDSGKIPGPADALFRLNE